MEGPIEGPERGAVGAKRLSAEGGGVWGCAVAPPQYGGLGAMWSGGIAPENF